MFGGSSSPFILTSWARGSGGGGGAGFGFATGAIVAGSIANTPANGFTLDDGAGNTINFDPANGITVAGGIDTLFLAQDVIDISDASGNSSIITPTLIATVSSSAGVKINAGAAGAVSAGQIGIGSTHQTTIGAAGGASTLPLTPLGYWLANVDGIAVGIPYYAAS